VTKLMIPYREMALNFKRQVVAQTTAPFPQDKTTETALGNLMADAVLAAAQQQERVQFAIMNAGGIRSNLPEGPVTYDNIFKLMPFNNSLVIADLTGKELTQLIEIGFSGALGPLSVSGLKVKTMKVPLGQKGPWERDLNGDGIDQDWERDLVVKITDANGRPLDDTKIYHVATNTYLAEGGDYQNFVYDKIPDSRIHIHYDLEIRDILAQFFKEQSPLAPAQYYTEAKARVIYVPETRS
jgi:2',3'-cyclic-nucleotide 2'-phosphodiesterase (5'-nucleotidase family)